MVYVGNGESAYSPVTLSNNRDQIELVNDGAVDSYFFTMNVSIIVILKQARINASLNRVFGTFHRRNLDPRTFSVSETHKTLFF